MRLASCCNIVFISVSVCVRTFCSVIVNAQLRTVLFCLYLFKWTDGWTNRCLSAAWKDGGGWDTFGKTNRKCVIEEKICARRYC